MRGLLWALLSSVGAASLFTIGSLDLSHRFHRFNDLLPIDAVGINPIGVLVLLLLAFLGLNSLIKVLSTFHLTSSSLIGLVELKKLFKFGIEVNRSNSCYFVASLIS
jgi:hypothetical protein